MDLKAHEIELIVQKLPAAVQELQKVLSAAKSYHGVLRGSMQSVLAEAQGAEIVGPGGRPFNHYQNLVETLNALRKNSGTIRSILAQIRSSGDYQSVDELSRALRPLLDMAKQREGVMARTQQLADTLKTQFPRRLAGVGFGQGGLGPQGGRTMASLVTNQLRVLSSVLQSRGIDPSLLPKNLAASAGSVLEDIEQMPVDTKQAAAAAATTAASVRMVVAQVLARLGASAPNLLQRLIPLLESVWTVGGTLLDIPIIIIPVKNGKMFGMPGFDDEVQA